MAFSLGGLIGGAMKGFGEGYSKFAEVEMDKKAKMDYAERLIQLQEEKDKRLAEYQANLGIDTKKREIQEIDPLKTASEVNRTTAVGTAETGVLVGREGALRPGKVQTEMETGRARGIVERENLGAYANDPNARAGVRAKASDQEGPAAKTTAEAARWELGQKKAVADLRNQLSKTTKGSPERETLLQQISDLTGGSTKSYSDMVTAGDAFRKLAANLRQQLKDDPTMTEAEQADVRDRIKLYEEQAASVLGTTVSKRLGNDAPKPGDKPGKPTAAPKPWEKY